MQYNTQWGENLCKVASYEALVLPAGSANSPTFYSREDLCSIHGQNYLFSYTRACGFIVYDCDMGVPPCWTCNPRVSGSIPGNSNLKRLFNWMKIHGLQKNHNKDMRVLKKINK